MHQKPGPHTCGKVTRRCRHGLSERNSGGGRPPYTDHLAGPRPPSPVVLVPHPGPDPPSGSRKALVVAFGVGQADPLTIRGVVALLPDDPQGLVDDGSPQPPQLLMVPLGRRDFSLCAQPTSGLVNTWNHAPNPIADRCMSSR